MTFRTITAMFESSADAQEAQARLLSLGLAESDVRLVKQSAEATGDGGGHRQRWESIQQRGQLDRQLRIRAGRRPTVRVNNEERGRGRGAHLVQQLVPIRQKT